MRTLITAIVTTTLLVLSVPARAQFGPAQGPRSERPYHGLFAGDTGSASQLLTFGATFATGYDSDIYASQYIEGRPPGAYGGSTTFLTGSAQLGYSLVKSRVAFSAGGGIGIGHYPGLQDDTLSRQNAQVGVSYQLGRHSIFSAGQSESYQPLFFYAFLPISVSAAQVSPVFDPGATTIADTAVPPINGNQPAISDAIVAPTAEYYLASESDVGFTQGLTKDLSLGLAYIYRRSDSQSGQRDFTASNASARLNYIINKGLAAHAGYGYNDSYYAYTGTEPSRYYGHTVDAGVDYSKRLSFSRRTTFAFSTGTAFINDGVQTHFAVTGNAQLTHEMGRSWVTGLSYVRAVSYVETFRAPALSDSLVAALDGSLSRNVQFGSAVGYTRGNVGFTANNYFNSTFATAGLQVGLTRNWALSVDYAYYRYLFASGVLLPAGMGPNSSRQSIRAAINFWQPLIERRRSANATR